MSDDPFDERRYTESYPPSVYVPAGPPPVLTLLTPATSVVGVLVTVTLTGTGFVAGSVIQADGAGLPTVFVSATSLTVTGTPLVDGAAVITVRNPDGQTSGPLTFTVTTVALDEPQAEEAGAPA